MRGHTIIGRTTPRTGRAKAAGRRTDRFVAAAAALLLLSTPGCSDDPSFEEGTAPPEAPTAGEWLTYGGSLARTFYNASETVITRETASKLVPLWKYTTGGIVTAAPIVANVSRDGEGWVQAVFAPSWDGHLYALRADDGSLLWNYAFKSHPGASYPAVSSAHVEDIDGRRLLYIAAGMTLYCLDAATGELVWQFDAGTGCTDCDSRTERNEVESSPAVFEGIVYFGMDVNDAGPGKGGFFAIDARTGYLRWYFDLETATTCHANEGDEIRRFDGYHTAEELGLPADFLATRRGCDFDRRGTSCGNIWSSATIDVERRRIFTASSNCDTDDNPDTVAPPPPMPAFDAAIFALDIDTAEPVWRWRPRDVDNFDLSIGGVPNLFEIEFEGQTREVVGVGIKDGTYYVLDRDGTNEVTGRVEPYWQTQVVPGGSIGGIIASAAVGEGKVMFSTAVGLDLDNPQLPAAWALDADTGRSLWGNPDALPSFGPTTAIPGVTFMGSIGGAISAYDTETGAELVKMPGFGPIASPATVVDGRVYFGSGTGERGGNPSRIAYQVSLVPSPISVYCVAGTEGCPETGSCNDGNPCTSDEPDEDGLCPHTPVAEGTSCTLGTLAGACAGGFCQLDVTGCQDGNPCTRGTGDGASGCRFEPVEDGLPCRSREAPGECVGGSCLALEEG